MPDDDKLKDGTPTDKGTDRGTGSGGAPDGGSGREDQTRWTPDDWKRYADKRVTDAVTARDAHFKGLLADKDKDAEAKIAALQSDIGQAQSRATFADLAVKAGVRDVAGGYAVAVAMGYFDGTKLDSDALRKNHPGLFAGGGAADVGAGRGVKPSSTPMTLAQILARRG